jgi:chromosome segregation protein
LALYLKSITIKGFKSFPDRTRLEFGPGVSVVVGPNGSGKSNVTDAVLWALGEQSPVAVRGQSMQDVIFGGAPGRQAAKSAEVELVLDDSEGSLALGAPEISIFRRLDRSGDGEYRLAGARCRLIDVIELLSDTGLGKDMHSVISQGRVESIVTSKPRDRRLLIEEAAGLGKHRKRRRRAQLKLDRTQDNLDRALDVEREARSRLRPLKRQAEAAELHARLERQALQASWELAREELRGQRQALQEAQAAAAHVRAKREQLERELETTAKRREAAEEALAARSAQREELSRRSYAARSAAERVSYRGQAATAAAEAVQSRLSRGSELVNSLRAQAAAEQPDTGAGSRIAALEESLEALNRDRQAELARQLAELEQQLIAVGEEAARRTVTVEQALGERRRAEEQVERCSRALRDAERSVEVGRREAARVGGELAAVNQFLRNQARSPAGAAALADELEVDPGYELAVAAALDGRLRAGLVADRGAGSALLDRAGSEGGRVLVADGEIDAGACASAVTPFANADRLADHVRGGRPALALARVLLRDTWVVDALDVLPDAFDGVAVTRAGRVWVSRARELRQAPAVGEERVLSERNRREQLVLASESAARAELTARGGLEQAAGAASEADTARDRATAAHRAAIRVLDEAAEDQRRIGALIQRRRSAPDDGPNAGRRSQLTAELAAERQMLERAERERAERQARIARLDAAVSRDQALAPIARSVIEAIDDAAAAIAERVRGFEAALAADRQAGEHVAGELRVCAQQEAALHARLHQENESLTGAEVRLQRSRDQAADAEAELQRLASRLGLEAQPASEPLSDEERAAITTRLERLARRREQLGPVNPLAQEEYTAALAHVEELEAQRTDLETALRELEKLIADTDRQIRETFEHTFEATARNFEELASQLFPGGGGRLRLVTERGGPARVFAGQASPGGASHAPPPAQDAEDAEDAEDAASPAEEDLLGVEIEMTPAGKEMKRLTLLSGGEKSMTALAFLFAVFLARPCPFYILDEVEAALDDMNIDRFLELLRRYSSRAQFIVVTHQKRTMEAADSLYGVSMGGDGVSKVISRRLPEEQAA